MPNNAEYMASLSCRLAALAASVSSQTKSVFFFIRYQVSCFSS